MSDLTIKDRGPFALGGTAYGLDLFCAAAFTIFTILWLLYQGGDWWGKTNLIWPISADVWSRQNSQHPIDPYTLTHMLHGILCYWTIRMIFPKLPLSRQFFLAILFACGWELVENSSFVIERYRMVTASADYVGDAVINSTTDVIACGTGFIIARFAGPVASLAVFICVEATMLFWIKDNLILNVLMIVFPVDAVRAWQIGV